MKNTSIMKALCVSTTLFAVGLLVVLIGVPVATQADPDALKRLDANFDFFGFEAATTAEPPLVGPPAVFGVDGVRIYKKTVFVPEKANTLYLSFYTTGDAHNGAASCFTALLDGAFFNPGGQGAARCAGGGTIPVAGWIALLKVPQPVAITNCNDGGGGSGDCHDNAISYQWCAPIEPGTHTVEIWMASNTLGSTVFIEQAHFYVDASRIRGDNDCVQSPDPF